MTVGELIEQLQKYSKEAKVVYWKEAIFCSTESDWEELTDFNLEMDNDSNVLKIG